MPKDADGQDLEVGQVVTMTFRVDQILFELEEGTNIRLKAFDEIEGEFSPALKVNSKFVSAV